MSRKRWLVNLIIKTFSLRFILARLTKIPVIKQLVDKMLFDGDILYYLPQDKAVISKDKTLSIKIDQKVAQPEDFVLSSQMVDHFIDKATNIWLMNFCICRTANKCENYPQDYGCLFMGDAVLQINPEFGRLISREEAHEYVKKVRELGLVHLIGKNKLDTQWLGAGPGEKLLTVCNCCECCCLWKMLPNLPTKISRKVNKLPGVEVKVSDQCSGCGLCLKEVCFVDAISMEKEKAQIDQEKCRACGRCITICPEQAIEISFTNKSFIAEVTKEISSNVNVS
jgi:ferredoxin